MSARAWEAARRRDEAARKSAQREFDRPLALEAGAGTGKTTALVARIVSWALGPGWERAEANLAGGAGADGGRGGEGPDPHRTAARVLQRVVAITFTEAASAQMASVTGAHLREIAQGHDTPPGLRDDCLPADPALRRARAGALLGSLDHLVVRTIHAYCRRLLAAHPIEAGIHPGFEIDADGAWRTEVAREVIEGALRAGYGDPGDPVLLELANRGFGPQRLEEALRTLIEKAVPPDALFEDPFSPEALGREVRGLETAIAALEAALGGRQEGVRGRRDILLRLVDAIAATPALLRSADCGDAGTAAALVDRLEETWDSGAVGRLAEWSRGGFKTNEGKAFGDAAGAIASAAGELHARLTRLTSLDPILLDLARRALAPLLAETLRRLRRRGAIAYEGLLREARDLLHGHPDVLARVREGIDQLLVDEFQDTDGLQCEIIRMIGLEGPPAARPGLFVVGDPKQSIYGWRRADMAAYESFLQALRGAGGVTGTLSVNFRSVPAVLEEVERIIRPVMQSEEGVQPAFEPLAPTEKNESDPGFIAGGRAPVEHWVSQAWDREAAKPAEKTNAGPAAALEARALARDIRALHDDHGVPWRDFGVLFRARGDLETYLRAFRDEGIPFAVEGDRTYYRRREIVEAAALVRCVLDPNDHLALLTVLRSAIAGLPDAAIVPLWRGDFPDLMTHLEGADPERLGRIAGLVAEVRRDLPEDIPGLARIAGWEHAVLAAVQEIALARSAFRREPADRFVERLRNRFLIEATESARYLGAYRTANLDRFFRELLVTIEEGGGDAPAIARALRRSVADEEAAEEARPKDTVQDAVQVMTIHQAKGLDFEHVYVMQLHRSSSGKDKAADDAEMLGGRLEYRLLGAPTPGYGAVLERRRRVAAAELVRTLYVALTRAKKRLVMAGSRKPSGKDPGEQTHMGLLRGRLPDGPGGPGGKDALLLMAEAGAAGRDSHADGSGARWFFPDLRAREGDGKARRAPGAGALPGAGEIAADASALRALGREARSRMARPFSAPASAEAHEALRERLSAQAPGGDGEEAGRSVRPAGPPPDAARRTAMAAGTAVHRVLEMLDLEGETAAHLDALMAGLPAIVAGVAEPDILDAAVARARALLQTFAAGPLLERLRDLAPRVLSRETPLILPPGEDSGAVGFRAGAVDMLYLDPDTGEVVVADYKTDTGLDPAALSERARAYAAQGRVYVEGVRDALGLPGLPRFELWFIEPGRIETVTLSGSSA